RCASAPKHRLPASHFLEKAGLFCQWAQLGQTSGLAIRRLAITSNTRSIRYMDPLVLTGDMAGLPQAWVALEEAITYHARQMVAWSIGREVREFRGGWQRNGERSRISTKSILAIKGTGAGSHIHAPSLTNSMLFARDRQLCGYCGK